MIRQNVVYQYKHGNIQLYASTNTTIGHEPYYKQMGTHRGRDRMVVDLQLPVQ